MLPFFEPMDFLQLFPKAQKLRLLQNTSITPSNISKN